MTAETVWVAAAAAHLGFQVTVTLVVYPALLSTGPDTWQAAHETHGRRITPVVAMVYGGLVLAGGWMLWDGPQWPFGWVSLAAAIAAMMVTAFVAAPTHGRLGGGLDGDQVARLVRADRWRTTAAVIALLSALVAVA